MRGRHNCCHFRVRHILLMRFVGERAGGWTREKQSGEKGGENELHVEQYVGVPTIPQEKLLSVSSVQRV